MEEKKEIKVRLSTVISMFVIFILIIAFGVTYYFGFVADKEENVGDEKVTNTTENVVSNNVVENETKVEETVVTKYKTSKERFEEFMKNYKKNIKDWQTSLSNVDIMDDFFVTLEKGTVYFNINKDSNLYAKYGAKHKIAENVANIYMCEVGTGGMCDLVMLGYDGLAKSIFMEVGELSKEVKIETIKNVKNAVTVRCVESEDSGASYFIVDIDGNIY